MSEYNRHRWAMEWMHGGGRDPHGRSLDEEIKLGKEDWMERQRVAEGAFAPERIEMPNWRDLIREEGVQVGEQVAEGGRIGLQSGQLVQPGPGRQGYAGAKIGKTELKQLRKAGLEVSEIAGKFGVSVKTINNRLKEYDLLGTFKRVKPMSKRQAAQISKTLPEGVNITWDTSGGKGAWRVTAKVQKNNKSVFSKSYLNPEPKLINQLVKEYETQYKKYYPNALSDAEFEKLRFQKKNINLTSDEFANVLNEKGYKSYKYNESFTEKQVHNLQKKLDISDEVGKQIKPLTKSQQNTLINAFPEYADKWDFKANKYGLNFSEVGEDVWSMLRSTADDTKRWPTGGTAKSRLWHNAYRSALKGGDSGRFRILHPKDGEIMSRDEILKYNWTKGSSNVEFLDTLTDKKFNYDGFEKWMNNDAVPGQADANRFKNAANQYDLNKKLKQTSVGDKTFGNLLNEKFKGKASKQLRFSGLINHHLHDIADNFWDTDIVFFKDNIGVAKFEKSARDALKTAATLPEAEQTKFLKSFTNKFKDLGPIRLVEGELTLGAYDQEKMLKHVGKQVDLSKEGFKSWRAKVNAGKAATLAKALELKGIKICQKGIVEKESGGRIGFAGKCGTALALDNPNLFMRLAKESKPAMELFKSGQIGKYLKGAKSWTLANMGPAGWIGGEILIMGLGTLYETSQGKGWKEGLDTWTGLGGHFGMSEKRLKEIGKEQGWSDQQVYDAIKVGKLMELSHTGQQKEAELEDFLERQDIGGTARFKSSDIPSVTQNITGALYDEEPSYPDYSGTRNIGERGYIRGKYQDPKFLRDLKEEVPEIWKEGDALYKSLMHPQTSAALLQELQDRKKYEELETKNKIWEWTKKRPFVGQQVEAPEPSDLGPFERSPGHPGYTGAFMKWKPDFYAEGGIASLKKK